MSQPDLLPAITPLLARQLKLKTNQTLAKLVRTNYKSQFAQTATELAELRDAMAAAESCGIDSMDDASLSETFRSAVRLTTYEAYAPLLVRFHEKPCRESAVVDLFVPGLPDYLVESSSTSGGVMKIFPKYNISCGPASLRAPARKRTQAFIYSFAGTSLEVENEDNRLVKKIYSTGPASVGKRLLFGLDPEKDGEKMATFVHDHAAPFAVGFIGIWRSFLLIHGLFALDSKILETLKTPFLSTFVELMRYLDAEFDMIVDCIDNGRIPDIDGLTEIRCHLETNLVPNPERAAELRRLGRPAARQGWCSHAWPDLRSISATASGSFASYIPLARWFLGSNSDILAVGFGSTEGWIGSPYNSVELNKFKLRSEIIIEFLDSEEIDSVNSIIQPWEAKQGRRYEVVLTTKDGLWRYCIRDVVSIAGFDPGDGTPVIEFVERKNIVMRFPTFMVTENELVSAILLVAADSHQSIVDWTSAIDGRQLSATVGFFIELTGVEAPVVADFALAAKRILSQLNREVARAFKRKSLGNPTFRIVPPGPPPLVRIFRVMVANSTPSTKTLDHVIHLTPPGTIDEASQQFKQLGFNVVAGGTHAGGLTSNALVILADGVYLELISFAHPASHYPPGTPDRRRRDDHPWADKHPGWIDFSFLGSTGVDAGGTSIARIINARAELDGSGVRYTLEELGRGGRTRPDGRVLEWVLSTTDDRLLRGIVPFFCGDLTPREWRVPIEPPSNTIHPSGATGIAHVRLLAQSDALVRIAAQLTSVIGEPPQPHDSDDGESYLYSWMLEVPYPNARKPRLILSAPTIDEEREHLAIHGPGIFEVGLFWVGHDDGNERRKEDTPYGKMAWLRCTT